MIIPAIWIINVTNWAVVAQAPWKEISLDKFMLLENCESQNRNKKRELKLIIIHLEDQSHQA